MLRTEKNNQGEGKCGTCVAGDSPSCSPVCCGREQAIHCESRGREKVQVASVRVKKLASKDRVIKRRKEELVASSRLPSLPAWLPAWLPSWLSLHFSPAWVLVSLFSWPRASPLTCHLATLPVCLLPSLPATLCSWPSACHLAFVPCLPVCFLVSCHPVCLLSCLDPNYAPVTQSEIQPYIPMISRSEKLSATHL